MHMNICIYMCVCVCVCVCVQEGPGRSLDTVARGVWRTAVSSNGMFDGPHPALGQERPWDIISKGEECAGFGSKWQAPTTGV